MVYCERIILYFHWIMYDCILRMAPELLILFSFVGCLVLWPCNVECEQLELCIPNDCAVPEAICHRHRCTLCLDCTWVWKINNDIEFILMWYRVKCVSILSSLTGAIYNTYENREFHSIIIKWLCYLSCDTVDRHTPVGMINVGSKNLVLSWFILIGCLIHVNYTNAAITFLNSYSIIFTTLIGIHNT